MDAIADYLGIDRTEVRSRNFILPSEMPYDHGLLFQDGRPLKYDSGDFPASLAKLKALVGWDDFAAYREQAEAEGRRVGLGHRLLRRGHRRRPLRGRAHPDRDERSGQRVDRPHLAGPGARDVVRPDRRAGARGPDRRRLRHDRRHPPDALCRRDIRLAGGGDERQRDRAGRAQRPGQGAADRGRRTRGLGGGPRDRRRHRPGQGRPRHPDVARHGRR